MTHATSSSFSPHWLSQAAGSDGACMSPADARPAIPPGVYRATIAPDEPKRAYRVTIAAERAHAVRHRRKEGGLRLRSARSGQVRRLGRG